MLLLDVTLDRGRFHLEAEVTFQQGVTGLFGPSGSGKSTILAIIAGLVRPDRGRIALHNEVLYDSTEKVYLAPHRRRIGLVFQDTLLFPHYSVRNNLLYGFHAIPEKNRRVHFDEIVNLLGLGPLLKARPCALSGGEKQRVALGRSLLASPRLLLLDEPLTALDAACKSHILPFLKTIRDELQLPMIFVSHTLPEILHLTDELVFIKEGRILEMGSSSVGTIPCGGPLPVWP